MVFEELSTIYGADSQTMLLKDTGILRARSLHLMYSLFLILTKDLNTTRRATVVFIQYRVRQLQGNTDISKEPQTSLIRTLNFSKMD